MAGEVPRQTVHFPLFSQSPRQAAECLPPPPPPTPAPVNHSKSSLHVHGRREQMFCVGVSAGRGRLCSRRQLPRAGSHRPQCPPSREQLLPEALILLFKEPQQLDPFLICLYLHSFPLHAAVPEFWDGLQGLQEDGVEWGSVVISRLWKAMQQCVW